MKNIKIFSTLAYMFLLAGTAVSCSEPEEKVEPVYLRYDAEDSYVLPATGAGDISFVVRSDHPWEVYSYNPDWCTISPSTGDTDEKYTVTVGYNDNPGLDARIDTLVIQSGYWIGKWVTVTQEGNAYLTVEPSELNFNTDGGSMPFTIHTNQKWSVEVTSGADWLEIESQSSGEGQGTVTLQAMENEGRMRYATVTVYDRNGDEAASVAVVQDGVQLEPGTTELHAYYNDSRVELNVSANTAWTVTKDDAKAEWFRFENDTFNGNGTLVVLLDQNQSSVMRETTFTLSTISDGGSDPVSVRITLKQAWNNVEHFDFKDNPSGWNTSVGTPSIGENGITFTGRSRYNRPSSRPGTYTFHISHETSDAFSTVFLIFGSQEIRWHLDAASKRTVITLNPGYGGLANTSVPFDPSQENEVTMVMTEAESGFMKLEWLLNGEKVTELLTTEGVLSNALWDSNMTVTIGANTGTVVFAWYEYAAPMVWDE